MTKQKQFKTLLTVYKENLTMFVPIVARVHGGTHPEFLKVKEAFERMIEKDNRNESVIKSFDELRTITSHYRIPEDVCETYAAVYQMLAELDQTLREGN